MVDIETLGLSPGCVVLSIGAVRFNAIDDPIGATDDVFYAEIDRSSAEAAGLTVDPDTEDWWRGQDGFDTDSLLGNDGLELEDALASLAGYIGDADEIWANSPAFDCSVLEAAYEAVGLPAPWEFYQERDVRTVRALPGAVELEQEGREHHALADAKHQAREVAETFQVIQNA